MLRFFPGSFKVHSARYFNVGVSSMHALVVENLGFKKRAIKNRKNTQTFANYDKILNPKPFYLIADVIPCSENEIHVCPKVCIQVMSRIDLHGTI
jgi:hypothetical protein